MKPVSPVLTRRNTRSLERLIGRDQPEYLPLPAICSPSGMVTTCWKMTWRERIIALFTGRVYVQQLTFGYPLQPQRVAVEEPLITDCL